MILHLKAKPMLKCKSNRFLEFMLADSTPNLSFNSRPDFRATAQKAGLLPV